LDGPAPTLFEIYERLLLRLQSRPKSTQDLIRSALIWILFPRQPLNFKELCQAVTIRVGSEKEPAPAAIKQIRKFCSSLIREAADGNHLEAAHFTVEEFFNNITKDSHPHIAHFCLSKEGAYLEISKVCLTYLNFKDFISMQSITGPSMQKTTGLIRMFLYWQSNFSSLRCQPISSFGVIIFFSVMILEMT